MATNITTIVVGKQYTGRNLAYPCKTTVKAYNPETKRVICTIQDLRKGRNQAVVDVAESIFLQAYTL